MNKVLFPSVEGYDFAPNGTGIGWVPVSEDQNLSRMAERITIPENAQRADHAIPSPVAHIMEYRRKLFEGDEKTAAEWRGMLAAIALQRILALKITTKDIPIKNDARAGNPSLFGSVIGEALIEHGDKTGFTEKDDTLTVFCKDDIPFAMVLPGMIICPFKEYPSNLFADVEWYDEKSSNWSPVRSYLLDREELTRAGEKLWIWLREISVTNNFTPLTDYMNYISRQNVMASQEILPIAANYGSYNISKEIDTVCPKPTKAPENAFADKLFIIIPPENHPPATGSESKLEPRLCRTKEKNRAYYIVPPVHDDLVNGIKNGAYQLMFWDVRNESSDVENKYRVTLRILFPNNETVTYTQKFDSSKIAWTNGMPYISVWPFAEFEADSWREHFVSVWPDEGASGRRLDSNEFIKSVKSERVAGKAEPGDSTPAFKVSVINKRNSQVQIYNCTSSFRDKSFTMHRSDSQTFALKFSYVTGGKELSLGAWAIDRSDAKFVGANPPASHVVISMDFGTTSTNVYINDEGATINNCTSIKSPGKFLKEVYNPYEKEYDGKLLKPESELYQNYYLFSAREDALGKIFTYGQNFEARDERNALVGDFISNVSGRAVVVDEAFICNTITNGQNAQDICRQSRIYNNLKLNSNIADQERDNAAKNFIKNILTQAVLEACVDRAATAITIRVSYPAQGYGSTVLNNLVAIANELSAKCGKSISIAGATEALAAGTYFAEYYRNTQDAPDPKSGYLIVDIGGGTTDVSYWRQEDGELSVQLKQEHSFGYAGKFLVTKTIIQAMENKASSFEQMWSERADRIDSFAETQAVIKGYIDAGYVKGINYDVDPGYQKKAVSLDFILENSELNSSVLDQDNYKTLISTMRMKYYALFYLIASYVRKKMDNGNIRLSDGDFKICFAGCGSKGMDICKAGVSAVEDAPGFLANVGQIFKVILELDELCAFGVTMAPNRDKKEVVVGLGILNSATPIQNISAGVSNTYSNWRTRNVAAQATEHMKTKDATTESTSEEGAAAPVVKVAETHAEKVKRFMEAYSDLHDMLKDFEGETELIKTICLDNPLAEKYFINILTTVCNQLEASNCDPETENECFALFMLDNMLGNFIQ